MSSSVKEMTGGAVITFTTPSKSSGVVSNLSLKENLIYYYYYINKFRGRLKQLEYRNMRLRLTELIQQVVIRGLNDLFG